MRSIIQNTVLYLRIMIINMIISEQKTKLNMSFTDFLQNVQLYGTYIRLTTVIKWLFVACLITFYFVYVLSKLITLWIPLIWVLFWLNTWWLTFFNNNYDNNKYTVISRFCNLLTMIPNLYTIQVKIFCVKFLTKC